MQQWFTSKMEHITKEFIEGGGYGAVYEAQFLVYLEAREVACHGGDTEDRFWLKFTEACKARTPEGKDTKCFAFYIEDRQELVDALAAFARQFTGPRRTKFAAPKESTPVAQPEPPTSSTDEPKMDLFDLLSEEDDPE